MDTAVAETAAGLTQPYLQSNSTKTKAKNVRRTHSQSATSQRNQKPHNWQPKSTSSSSFRDPSSVVDAPLASYRDAPWFKAGDGDLFFSQWLLNRCIGVGDATTPQSEAATQRLFVLYKAQRKLRRELALGSKRDEASSDKDIEEEDEEEEHGEDEEPLWSVEEIVEHVGDALLMSRRELQKQTRIAERNHTKLEGAMERIVVAEVVDNATELILSRATREQETLLRRWMKILKDDKAMDEVETVEVKLEIEGGGKKKIKKKMRGKKSKSNATEDTACEQVESFLTFLKESAKAQTLAQASVSVPPSEAIIAWTAELQRIVELSSIEPEEEERRKQVALDIQTVLRQKVPKWRHCKVIVFGSSVTHFGSRHSDLDMCLLPNGQSVGRDRNPVLGKRQLQRLVNGNLCGSSFIPASDTEMVLHLQDLLAQVQKSSEKLTQALNSLDRSSKKSDKQTKLRRQLDFFFTQMRLLRSAIVTELTQLNGAEPHNNFNTDEKSARLKKIIAASKRSSEDLYLLRATLQRAVKCEVRHVIAGARVPIIRFLHTRSGREYECDLCFENVLATRNTPLLRAYAAFDDRARTLGLAVKHWAKQRGISDASMGFLSSYSFVLLSIYYLQVMHVLPNLQDPQLLQSANILPEYYNDINIAFCQDRRVAQAFHKSTWGEKSSDVLVSTLLAGFFKFYATQFDFAQRVVTVRSPDSFASKLAQWGHRKAKTWRMSIQDPLETGRDLGCVLQFKGQEKIICELRRAHEMLARGESFSDKVCDVEKAADKAIKVKQLESKELNMSRKRTMEKDLPTCGEQTAVSRQQEEKEQRSYVIILQSADEELTRVAIETFFRSFQKSFRVTDVREIAPSESLADGNGNKRWAVELLTQARHCPRALSMKTRIDWKAADGRIGRVWVHHEALFATPPCQNCLSPKHATGKCPPDEDNDEEGGGSREKKALLKNVRRHVLRLTICETSTSEPAKKGNRRNTHKPQRTATVHDTDRIKKPNEKLVHRNNSGNSSLRAKSNFQKDEKAEVAVKTTLRRVEITETVRSSSTARVEAKIDTSAKVTPQKKKWRQRPSSKKASLKGDNANAAAE